MLKNAILFKIHPRSKEWNKPDCEKALQAFLFVPTEGAQDKSVGFVPPRGHEHGELVESSGANWFFRVAVETKSVPSSVVNEKLKAKVAEVEQATGRKPGRKEQRELIEEIIFSLLPTAFPKRSTVNVWLDHSRKLLIVDASSQSKADEVVSLLVKCLELHLSVVQTEKSPGATMTEWLLAATDSEEGGPMSFILGKELVLKADDVKAQVKYTHHPLDSEAIRPEIRKHITSGKIPRSLELAHEKAMLSFVLTEALTLKKICFSDDALAGSGAADDESKSDRFDADVLMMTANVGRALDDLFEELGGEMALSQA